MTPANPPSSPIRTSPGTWLRAIVALADGSHVELRLPGVIAGSVSTYEPDAHEVPSLTVIKDGHRRRGRLSDLLAGP